MKLVEKQWLSYRAQVLPRNAPLIQVQECRRAFYAGAQCLLHSIMSGLEPGMQETGKDLEMMAAIERELSDFAEAVAVGVK